MSITRHEAIQMMLAELDRAYSIHPKWPKARHDQSVIVMEKAKELEESTRTGGVDIKFAVQTAAMAIRFLEATP